MTKKLKWLTNISGPLAGISKQQRIDAALRKGHCIGLPHDKDGNESSNMALEGIVGVYELVEVETKGYDKSRPEPWVPLKNRRAKQVAAGWTTVF